MDLMKSLSKILDSTFLPHSFPPLHFSIFTFNVALFYTNMGVRLFILNLSLKFVSAIYER